jgi:hypothetical protein
MRNAGNIVILFCISPKKECAILIVISYSLPCLFWVCGYAVLPIMDYNQKYNRTTIPEET